MTSQSLDPNRPLTSHARPLAACAICLAVLAASPAGAAPNEWTTVGYLSQARQNHTATLLPDGSVLVAGGDDGADARFAGAVVWNPLTGGFAATGTMAYGRSGHTASLLADGRVLVAGGTGLPAGLPGTPAYLSSAEVWDPVTGDWELLTDVMGSARSGHSATVLHDGRVLVAGGRSGSLTYTASADLFDPATDTFAPTASLPSGRNDHSATLLPDGRVLVVGGFAGSSGTPPLPTYLATAAIYDPDLGTFAAAASISGSRGRHTATLLRNGRVLVAGGRAYSLVNGFYSRDTAATYDPATDTWSAAGTLSHARAGHSASLIATGLVMVCGGADAPTGNSCDWYNATTNAWTYAPTMTTARTRHTATVLPDGSLLAVGGMDGAGAVVTSADRWEPPVAPWGMGDSVTEFRTNHSATLLGDGSVLVAGGQGTSNADVRDSCERYDPAADLWTATGSLTEARTGHTATRLADGRVLVVGGYQPDGAPPHLAATEIYDPGTGTWTPTGSMANGRSGHTTTLLGDGRVLVAGGYYYDGSALPNLASAEVFDPATGVWTVTGSLAHARSNHTATLLPDGRVLVAGGFAYGAYPAQAELFDPAAGTWSTTGSLSFVRQEHTATLLPDGRVLLVGGWWGGTGRTWTELYRPSSGTWSLGNDLGTGFGSHSATLLPDGQVLVVGGLDQTNATVNQVLRFDPAEGVWSTQPSLNVARKSHTSTLLHDGRLLVACGSAGSTVSGASVELGAAALGVTQTWRPPLGVISSELRIGEPAIFSGSGLLGGTEASSGTTQSSSSGFPLVQLRRLDNEQLTWLRPGPDQPSRDTEIRAAPLPAFPEGPVLVTVFANGVPSVSRPAVVVLDVLFADDFESGGTGAWSAAAP
ncbi:MAG TPA: kelch repeat-containing protein [Candidatus Sulfomarinibacteraceae bacterium]|nr:kelch repeat-containing protein [Candidatus Sulfomarinibacteraceae bacterium]